MMTHPEKPWYSVVFKAFLLEDVPRLLEIPPAAFARDVDTFERRLASEGESFITKTLPTLGKAIDRALQGNTVLFTTAFKKAHRTKIPVFMQVLFRRVFSESGWVKVDPCIDSIRMLRQVCYWCKKVEKGYSDESLQLAVKEFIQIDQSLPECEEMLPQALLGTARAIIEHMFAGIGSIRHRPRHGPGAVASGDTACDKRKLSTKYTQLERVFRPIPWFFSLRDASESIETVLDRPCKPYGLSRTEFVEKDSSGPRTIGLEPSEYMWVQQAVKGWMYTHLETRSSARGQVNFTNQDINRNLALYPDEWETLDMSKASDRNSFALVKALFKNTRLWPYLQASRTPGTVLPNGDVLLYKKFAPMGSAVCFPVQACVYYALACATLHFQGMPLVLAFSRVFVYGDDLIVPRGYFSALTRSFESVQLRFNPDKCCTHGKFRESCGMDAYDGVAVTPLRMRKVYQTRQHSIIPSIVKHANSLMSAGYRASAAAFRLSALAKYSLLEELRLPWTKDPAVPILAWFNYDHDTVRRSIKRSIPYIHGWVFQPNQLECTADGEVRFLRESLSLGGPVGEFRKVEIRKVRWRSGTSVPDTWPHFVGPSKPPRTCTYTLTRVECRVLATKYSGSLRRKAIPYWPSCEESQGGSKWLPKPF